MSQDRQDDYRSPLSPSECNLFSLYMQYPNLNFDADEVCECLPVMDPTICSTQKDLVRCKMASQRSLVVASHYHHLLHKYTKYLPQETIFYFTKLGDNVVQLSRQCSEESGGHRAVVQWLERCMTYSAEAASDQTDRIQQLRQLLAFTCTPSEDQLWCIFQQRTKLITSTLSLPTKEELRLVEALVALFDNQTYIRRVTSSQHGERYSNHSASADEANRHLHNLMHVWLDNIRQWCKSMYDLKMIYMQPIYNALRCNPRALGEMKDFDARCARVRAMNDRQAKTCVPVSDLTGTMSKSNSSVRQPGVQEPRRMKTRYKREHTI